MVDGVTEATESASNVPSDPLAARKARRQREREGWDAYFKVMDIETKGTIGARFRYNLHRFLDSQVTFIRENLIEPLQDRYKKPYYHRRISRVPHIGQCTPNDFPCIWQANEQYRLEKAIDYQILSILEKAANNCLDVHQRDMSECVHLVEDFEEADLNYFIKYGELGASADARHCLMKQKHRMIWERRHPEIMEARERLLREHKEKLANGIFDYTFWRRNVYLTTEGADTPYKNYTDSMLASHQRVAKSKDPQYYREKRAEGKTGDETDPSVNVPFWPYQTKTTPGGSNYVPPKEN